LEAPYPLNPNACSRPCRSRKETTRSQDSLGNCHKWESHPVDSGFPLPPVAKTHANDNAPRVLLSRGMVQAHIKERDSRAAVRRDGKAEDSALPILTVSPSI
ncbi:MAG: hypothetical protein BJ554DRAFT_1036, partial [Olpidium bornovanus]